MQQCLYNFVSSVVSIVSRFPKKSDLEGRVIIGIDECNNGRSIPGLPFICAAYVSYPTLNERGKYTHDLQNKVIPKGHGLGLNKLKRKAYRKKALGFLREHGNFKYFAQRNSIDKVLDVSMRASSTARLIKEASSFLSEEPIVILDGYPFCRDAKAMIAETLDRYGIGSDNVFFRKKADSIYMPVTIADRVAYCLGSVRFGGIGTGRKWPHRHKKIDLKGPLPELYEEDILAFEEKIRHSR